MMWLKKVKQNGKTELENKDLGTSNIDRAYEKHECIQE